MSAVLPRRQAGKVCPNERSGPLSLDRWEFVSLVTALRREIGLSDRDVTVLRAHISALPHGPLSSRNQNISFMGLTEVSERTCGMDERRIRRGETRLEEAGIVIRRLSANGRRFPERDGSGSIVNAYGIDLSPIFEKYLELLDLRYRLNEERLALRQRRNKLSARLQDLLRRLAGAGLGFPEWAEKLHRTVRNATRRKTVKLEDLISLEGELDKLEDKMIPIDPEISDETPTHTNSYDDMKSAVAPDKNAEDDGQCVRHIESKQKENIKKGDRAFHPQRIASVWKQTRDLQEFYPESPQVERKLAEVLIQFSSFIGLGQTAVTRSLAVLGWESMVLVVDYMAGNIAKITRPEGYLASMIRSYEAGQPIAGGQVVPRHVRQIPCKE